VDFNHWTSLGRLTRDPETSFTSNQTQLTKFGFATSTGWGDNKKPLFIDCACWGKTAEIAAKHLTKGKAIHISGQIEMDQWEKDGQKRSKLACTVREISFLPGEQQSPSQPQAPAPPPIIDETVPF
jgi:single-strand DNA-binding protein